MPPPQAGGQSFAEIVAALAASIKVDDSMPELEGAQVSPPWGRARAAVVAEFEGNGTLLMQSLAGLTDWHEGSPRCLSRWADPGADKAGLARLRSLEDSFARTAVEAVDERERQGAGAAKQLLLRARCDPSALRRVLAVYLVEQLPGAAEARPRERRLFSQCEAGVETSARARAAHAALEEKDSPGMRPASLIPHMASQWYLKRLKEVARGEGPPRRAHAMDPYAMWHASPLRPGGGADERGRVQLEREAQRLVEEAQARPSNWVPPEPAPDDERVFDGVEMIIRHREAGGCLHCDAGDCAVAHVAALATAQPVIFYPGQRPSVKREPPEPRVYPLSEKEVRMQGEEVQKLWACGRASLAEAPLWSSPTFFAYKSSFAPSLEWAEAELATPGVAARVEARVEASLAGCDEGTRAGRPPGAGAIAAALGAQATTDKGRLVFDYSSLNEKGVAWPFALCGLGEIARMVHTGDWIASVDISAGYHRARTHERDRPYLTFARLGVEMRVLEPNVVMFGLRQAPAAFSTITAEVVATAARRIRRALGESCGIRLAVYIDDIFVIGSTKDLTERALAVLREHCGAVGAVLKEAKMRPPSQDAPVRGMRIDTVRGEVYLPADKRYSMLFLASFLIAVAARGWALPVAPLQKLTGKLSHFVTVYERGRPHLAPLYDACERAPVGTSAVVDALTYFRGVLSGGSRAGAFTAPLPNAPGAPPGVLSYSDAAGDVGCSINMGPIVIWARWRVEKRDQRVSIGAKEMYPLVLLQECAGDLLALFDWCPRTDNLPNVFSMLKGHTDDAQLRPWLAALLVGRAGRRTVPGWEPRDYNAFMDGGSKAETVEAVRACMREFRAC